MTNEEMILKAREAKSPDELLNMAHGAGMTDFTEENARVYFNALNQSGEMSDEEIDAAGGGCAVHSHGQKMVTYTNRCGHWKCEYANYPRNHGKKAEFGITPRERYLDEEYLSSFSCSQCKRNSSGFYPCNKLIKDAICLTCYYLSYERGAWWCNSAAHYNE